MKPILVFLSFFILMVSCSVDDPKIVTIQNATVVNVVAPDTLRLDQPEIFEVSYINPTTCHTFEKFDLLGEEPLFTIRTETRFENTFDCQQTPGNEETVQFQFTAESLQDHVIRFLAGASDSGQLQYITFDLPVKVE